MDTQLAHPLLVQEEMVDRRLQIGETAVGTTLYNMQQNYLTKHTHEVLISLDKARAEELEELVRDLATE
jgi:hypothetical protein